jgi:hypothetical protein
MNFRCHRIQLGGESAETGSFDLPSKRVFKSRHSDFQPWIAFTQLKTGTIL